MEEKGIVAPIVSPLPVAEVPPPQARNMEAAVVAEPAAEAQLRAGSGLYRQRAPRPPASAASSMSQGSGQRASRALAGDNRGQQFLLHVKVQSVLQIDVEVEEPETSENPTQSFEIHNCIFQRCTQLLAMIIYSI